jgi:PKD repeat protein
MTISFTYDANGLVDDAGAHAWAEFGIRDTTTTSNFNPTWMVEGKGVWLATDYDWTVNTFDPDPVGAPTLDLDDKLILQKAGGHGEGDYNLPSAPPVPGNNHRVWWDRDGVDPWQNDETANTGGLYNIIMTLHAVDATSGTAYLTIRNLNQGFETDGNWNTIELTPAGMTFTGDMKHMQVFYGLYGYGATHSVAFKNITIIGYLANRPPVADPNGPYLGAVGEEIQFDGSGSSDPDDVTLTYAWDFGDGSSGDGATPTHSYGEAGIYDVCLTVDDGFGGSASACTIAVVYDPAAGFVTGGGWIMSPAGAYTADPSLAGKATFGFVAKYKKGANVPDGNTEFQFKAGDLNFKSTSYEWLVVAGTNAKFKGVGTINGEGSYKFMITADDGSPDKFRIQIWDAGNGLVYDNGSQQSLGGGSIVIHK